MAEKYTEEERPTLKRSVQQPCLHAVDLFQDIPAEEMEALNAMLPLKKVEAGELIYDPTQQVQRLFVIKAGRVRVFQTAANGKALTMAILEVGSVFGQMPMLGQSMGNNYAEAMETSLICQLTQSQVAEHFLSDPRISVRVAKILGQRVNDLEERLADMVLKPLPSRLAGLLLQLASPSPFSWGKRTTVRLTHEQLASLAGATREAVSKVLSQFSQQGFIRQSRGKIILLSLEALAHLRLAQGDV